MNGFNEVQEGKIREYLKSFGLKPEDTTCHTCPSVTTCPFSYDPYNIEGDCLMEK
jgi:hypothetical protein